MATVTIVLPELKKSDCTLNEHRVLRVIFTITIKKTNFHGNGNNFVTEAEKKWLHGKGPQFVGFWYNNNKKITFHGNGNIFVTETEKKRNHAKKHYSFARFLYNNNKNNNLQSNGTDFVTEDEKKWLHAKKHSFTGFSFNKKQKS